MLCDAQEEKQEQQSGRQSHPRTKLSAPNPWESLGDAAKKWKERAEVLERDGEQKEEEEGIFTLLLFLHTFSLIVPLLSLSGKNGEEEKGAEEENAHSLFEHVAEKEKSDAQAAAISTEEQMAEARMLFLLFQ